MMNQFTEFFKEDLIFCNVTCNDQQHCFEKVSEKLLKKGLVRPSFANALIKREQVFPTGLNADPYQVAIPHTDPEHVIKPFVAIIKLEDSVEFMTMGSEANKINAEMVFVLGITKPESQVLLLQNLIEMFMDQPLMDELLRLNDRESIYKLLKNNIRIEGRIQL